MNESNELKDAIIEFETSKYIKILLQEVANSLGMDLSNFLISTAVQRVKKIQKEEKILLLSKQESTAELKELMNSQGFDK